MFDVIYQLEGARRRHLNVVNEQCTIGSGRRNDLIIKNRKVSKRHASIALTTDGLCIEDLGSSTGTWVNRERVIRYGPINSEDEITIGNVTLWIVADEKLQVAKPACRFDVIYQLEGARRRHLNVVNEQCTIGSGRRNDLIIKNRKVSKRHASIALTTDGLCIEDLGSSTGTWVNRERVIRYGPINSEDEITIGNVTLWIVADEKLQVAKPASGYSTQSSENTSAEPPALPARDYSEAAEQLLYWGKIIHERLIAEMDLRRKDVHNMTDQQLRAEAEQLLDGVMAKLDTDLPAGLKKDELRTNVLNEAVGLGPLEQFLAEEAVTEIMVNNHAEIFIERNGKLTLSEQRFSSDFAVQSVIERIITPLGRRIDESSPMVDARLKDGSRVNAIIPPLAIRGPSLTIRKFATRRLLFTDLIAFGSINQAMVDFMRICVEQRKNIIVSGGTGSGKTTLLWSMPA